MKAKHGFLVGALLILLAITVYANHLISQPKDTTVEADTTVETQYQEMTQEEIAAAESEENAQYGYSDTEESIPVSSSSTLEDDYFAVFRTDRDSVREKELEYLQTIVADASTDADTKKEAQQQQLNLVDYMEKEVTIEGLIKAKGFSDVAVTISSGSVNVVVEAETLDDTQVAQILDIVKTESGQPAENIKIMPKS